MRSLDLKSGFALTEVDGLDLLSAICYSVFVGRRKRYESSAGTNSWATAK